MKSVLTGASCAFLWTIAPCLAQSDELLQQAVNYVFIGTTKPTSGAAIIDPVSCVVVTTDQKNKRQVRFYLNRFMMESAVFTKTYAGQQVQNYMEVKGDDIIVEYLTADGTSVEQGYKSAQIRLPGNIDQAQRALKLIFSDYCRAENPTSPF